ncbi:sulfotransferase family protein [Rhodanobacter geophilus]|uniref:Sulfotransferase family protein n=1 Tax=Rhodanobacter geophilus TaxID=3162488 RepID=A0ABV3QR07_9GAMM
MTDNHTHHAILVLGMHRSGTSAVTRVINLLGADLGSDLLPPSGDNALGFWENRGVVEIHEELLDVLGSSWHDVQPLPAGWLSTPAAIVARGKLFDTLRREFSNASLWAVKDPRLCRLLPLWQLVLNDLNVKAHAVFVVRHPDEVGRSLLARDGIPIAHTRLLWLQHLVEAEEATRDMSRVVISYDDLLRDWRECMQRMRNELPLQWPVSISEAHLSVEQFLNPRERHHKLSATGDAALPALAQQAYQGFIAKANGGGGWDRIRMVSELYSTNAGIFVDEIEVLEHRIRTTEEQWSLAATRVVECEAALSKARDEWGHSVELLRESEAKQQHAAEQWHATVQQVQTTEVSLAHAREQWEQTVERLRESEARQHHATKQWEAAAETVRTTNDQLEQAREQLNQLERRQRWILRGGVVVALMAAIAGFCFRMI